MKQVFFSGLIFFDANSSVIDAGVARVKSMLTPGSELLVKVFQLCSFANAAQFLSWITAENGILIGAHGIALVYDHIREKLPKDKICLSFDPENMCWHDSDGFELVPTLRADGCLVDHYFFGSNPLAFGGWGSNHVLLCFCLK